MNDLAASIGLAQLKKLPAMNKRRGEIINMYMDGISKLKSVKPLLPYEPDKYVYQMFGVRAENKEDLILEWQVTEVFSLDLIRIRRTAIITFYWGKFLAWRRCRWCIVFSLGRFNSPRI